MKEHIIWEDSYFWSKEDMEQWCEDMKSCDFTEDEDITDEEAYQKAIRYNDDYLDDEKYNLNQRTNEIIAIANLNLWDGHHQGYKLIGTNLNDIFNVGEDYNKYYCDSANVKALCVHHDGTNEILFRERKDGITDTQWDNFLNNIYNGKSYAPYLCKYTKSLRPRIKNIYGF